MKKGKYIRKIKEVAAQVKGIALLWPELWSLPIALLLWFVSPYVIQLIDDQAATFDSGILQIIVYVIIAITAFSSVVFLGIKFNFPVVFDFYKNEAGDAFNSLTKWQKIIVLLVLYIGLLLCCVWLAHIMVQPTIPA